MLCNKKGYCKHQGYDGWSEKPTCDLDYYKYGCQHQDRTHEHEQFIFEHADILEINKEKY